MKTFNSIYHLFPPQVANSERKQQQSLLQATAKTGLCTLLRILNCAKSPDFAASFGVTTGTPTSVIARSEMMTYAVNYLQVDTSTKRLQKKFATICKILVVVVIIAMALRIVGMLIPRIKLLTASNPSIIILLNTIISAIANKTLPSKAYTGDLL
jgi:magnesium-transporting ATPase (P-type)